MLVPGPVPKGGAVRLFPPAEAMGIAEGIETALSAAQLSGLPVWAALNTVNIEKGFEAGLAIVIVAILLDRLCRQRPPSGPTTT